MKSTETARATEAFEFATASYLVLIGNQSATNLLELERGLGDCSDASIFYHTFQSLGRHHFLTEGFSNDFAIRSARAGRLHEASTHCAKSFENPSVRK